MSLTIDGKEYELKESYAIHENDVETHWASDWGQEDTYEVNVATDVIRVEKCFVLVEVSKS